MTLEFLEEAEQELFEAALWYESKEAGLGRRFRDEIAHVLDRIVEDCFGENERVATDEPIVPSFRTISHFLSEGIKSS